MAVKTNGFTTKADLITYYNTYPKAFECMVDSIKPKISWKAGRQLFTPKQVRIIIDHLGEPLRADELRLK